MEGTGNLFSNFLNIEETRFTKQSVAEQGDDYGSWIVPRRNCTGVCKGAALLSSSTMMSTLKTKAGAVEDPRYTFCYTFKKLLEVNSAKYMPRARLELARCRAPGDFESPASTNSAIRARGNNLDACSS
jgi:hypothetical protein